MPPADNNGVESDPAVWGYRAQVRPDGHGIWSETGRRVAFFLEYDTGTESLPRLVDKVNGYAALERNVSDTNGWQSKSDQSPESWKPPLTSYYCTYARMWVKVKYVWALTVTTAEKSSLTSMLNTCSRKPRRSGGALAIGFLAVLGLSACGTLNRMFSVRSQASWPGSPGLGSHSGIR